MVEAIPHRPRNLRLYLTNRIRDLKQILTSLKQANQLVHDGVDGEQTLHYAIRSGTEDLPEREHAHEISNLEYLNIDREFNIERLLQALETYLQHGNPPGYDFLKYVISALDDVEKDKASWPEKANYLEQCRRAFGLLRFAEVGLEKYGYRPGHPEDEADSDYIAAKKLLAGYRLKAATFNRVVAIEADIRSKLGVIQRMRNHDYSGQGSHKYRPEHEEIETLYHATAYVREILRDGFQAEKPEKRKGVGNLGQQASISFTHDLEIARNIMRSFKEIWMIAHHQLTMPQIMSWGRAEGIEDDMKRMWGNDTSKPMPLGKDADPNDVVKMYRHWIALSKTRDNPMLISPWEIVDMMKTRDLKDIGVISCEAKLEKTDEYRFAEAEFRLSADRVIFGTIKQVL